MSLFPSQMRRLLEGSVYKRAAFRRGNTVTDILIINIDTIHHIRWYNSVLLPHGGIHHYLFTDAIHG